MILSKVIQQSAIVTESIVCDKCGEKYNVEDDCLEAQEFLHIRFTGGYGSVFGDMSRIQCDICQHCLFEMIKDIFHIKENFHETLSNL